MGQSRRGCARDSSAGRVSRATIASPPQTPPAAGVCRQMPPAKRHRARRITVGAGGGAVQDTIGSITPPRISRSYPRTAATTSARLATRPTQPARASGCRSASSAAHGPGPVRPTSLDLSAPPEAARLAMSDVGCTALWTAFVIGPDQSSPRGDCRRRTTGGLGAASLRPPLPARLRTECGLAAPLNRPLSRAARTSSRAWAVRSPRRSRPPRWPATRLWARVSPS